MKLEIEVDDQAVRDAFEAGLWGFATVQWCSEVDMARADEGVYRVTERESGKVFEVDAARVLEGLKLMAVETPKNFALVLGGAADAVVGDVLVQFAALGELKYA
jgi:uncharacterized membrane protein